MSEPTVHILDTEVLPADDWWYVRAYPGGRDRMDAAVAVTLPWLRAQVREVGADQWHFIRFWDASGHHIRARIHCTADAVDRLHGRKDELLELISDLPDDPTTGCGLLPLGTPTGPTATGISPALYSPELAKYGGADGVALAERIFTLDSSFHADLESARLPARTTRAALALEVMSAVVERSLPPEKISSFWAGHRSRWGWQLRSSLGTETSLGSALVAIDRDLRQAPTDLGRRIQIEQHSLKVTALLRQYGKPLDHYLLHHLHMMVNRFGFPPGVEAALGIISARRFERQEIA